MVAPIIYLHGYCSGPNSHKAKAYREYFESRKRTVYTPDLNGENFTDLTITGQLNQIREIASKFQGPIHLIGSSLGGYVASLFAQEEQRVSKVILMAPAFKFYQSQKKRISEDDLKRWKKAGTIHVDHHYYKKKCKLSYKFFEDAKSWHKIELIRPLDVLIFHGIHDKTVAYSVSEEHVKINNQSKLHLLPSDHSLKDQLDYMLKQSEIFLDEN